MSLTEQEIIEGNKLIAEFMQAKNEFSDIYYLPEFGHYFNSYGQIEWNDCFRTDELKYHSSWDWLMPVVEKIELDNSAVVINNNECMIVHYGKPDESIEKDFSKTFNSGNTKIETTWIAVVAFIKFYNNNLVQ